MMGRGFVVATLLSFAVLACGPPVHHVRSGPALAPKPDDAPIPVFFNEAPGHPYREIGQIRIRTRDADANVDHVLNAIVEDARRLGADAVIVDLRAHYSSLPVTVDCDGRPRVPPTDRLNARATAIIFEPAGGLEPKPTGPAPRPGCER